MAYDFPIGPTVGQAYNNYIWDGEKWTLPKGVTPDRPTIYAAPFDAMAYSGIQVNGSFDVIQERGAGTAVTAFDYIADGNWRYYFSAGAVTANIVNGAGASYIPPGLKYFATTGITTAIPSLAAGDLVQIMCAIEGTRWSRLAWGTPNAKPVTIGFWTAHKTTGVYSVGLSNSTAPPRSYQVPYTQNVSNAWEFKTVTIPGCTDGVWPIDNTNAATLNFAIAAGSSKITPTPNVWTTTNYNAAPGQVNGAATTAELFRITGIVILPGLEAPSADRSAFIMRPFDQELLTCQRYFQKQGAVFVSGYASAGSTLYHHYSIVPTMRSNPTYPAPTNTQYANMTGFAVGMSGTYMRAQAAITVTGFGYAQGDVILDARL